MNDGERVRAWPKSRCGWFGDGAAADFEAHLRGGGHQCRDLCFLVKALCAVSRSLKECYMREDPGSSTVNR